MNKVIKKIIDKTEKLKKYITEENNNSYSAIVYDDNNNAIEVNFNPNNNIDDILVKEHGFVRELITDFDRNNDSTVLIEEKYVKSKIKENKFFNKKYLKLDISECAKFTYLDSLNIPVTIYIPKQLRDFLVTKFNLHEDGYISYENNMITTKIFHNFLKDNKIEIAGIILPKEEIIDAPIVNMKQEINKIKKENTILLSSRLEEAIDKSISIDFILKYQDEGELYIKYANNIEVYKHYLNTFKDIHIYGIPDLKSFFDWYKKATQDIMLLSDTNLLNPMSLI